jgi:hypothetical protein
VTTTIARPGPAGTGFQRNLSATCDNAGVRERSHDRAAGNGGVPEEEQSKASALQSPPTWAEFDERPAAEFELRSPASELAAVLQRLRDDLDAAGCAAAESRAQGLRALAEQAVLAVELGKLLERHGPALDGAELEGAHLALAGLTDRMLAHIASSGLEVVRLAGAGAGDVADIVEVDSWRYDDGCASPVVVTEIEAAVRLEGAPLRRGRVVMGGVCDDVPAQDAAPQRPATPDERRASAAAGDGSAIERPPMPRIVCPIAGCGAENQAAAEVCVGCLTPLAGFARLSIHPGVLFNRGLRAARLGDSALARDCFAAVVLWHPHDVRTRNAHALACFDARDVGAARRGWEEVLARAPGDPLALRGVVALSRKQAPPDR